MPERSPEHFALITYLWVFGLATLGGLVSYLKKVLHGKKWKVSEFIAEIIASAFAGVITFYICEWAGVDQVGTAALVGIAGHSSSKALSLFDKLFANTMSKVTK